MYYKIIEKSYMFLVVLTFIGAMTDPGQGHGISFTA